MYVMLNIVIILIDTTLRFSSFLSFPLFISLIHYLGALRVLLSASRGACGALIFRGLPQTAIDVIRVRKGALFRPPLIKLYIRITAMALASAVSNESILAKHKYFSF